MAFGGKLNFRVWAPAVTPVKGRLYACHAFVGGVNEALFKSGLIPKLTRDQSNTKAEELYKLNEIEKQRVAMAPESTAAQLASAEAKLEQLRALRGLKRKMLDSLKVRAGIGGILQRLGETTQLQVGQQVAAGTTIARVSNPQKLKAEIRIPETQARDLALGQAAKIDTRNGEIPGRVIRIDPAAQNGTVQVDVALEGPLPRGARPDLSVDGTIMLEYLADVLYVGKPVGVQSDSTVTVFKLAAGGNEAYRVPVKFGSSSVTSSVVLEGLQEGDQIISSDMQQYDGHDRVRLD